MTSESIVTPPAGPARSARGIASPGRWQSIIGAVPLVLVAVLAEIAVLIVTFSYESGQTSANAQFRILGVGGWPLLACIIEAIKLPLAFFAAMALRRIHRGVANISVLIVCVITFTTLKEIGSQFVQEQLQPGRSELEVASETRTQIASLMQQLNDADAFGENRQYLEQDLSRVDERIAEKRDQLVLTMANFRADREQLQQSVFSPDVVARIADLDEQLAALDLRHGEERQRLEREITEAKTAAQAEIDAWSRQMEEWRIGVGAERESADRRFELQMAAYREALERYEASRLRYEQDMQKLIADEREELARIERDYEFQEADRRRRAEMNFAERRQERKAAFDRLPIPQEPRRESAEAAGPPESPPPVHQNAFVLEREAALASRVAEQRLERAEIASRRDEIKEAARTSNEAKVAEVEERERQLRVAEEEERRQIGDELRALEAEEASLRERLRSASLDPAVRAARRQELQDEIARLEQQAVRAETTGAGLIADSGPGRLAKFVPFIDREMPVLQRTEAAQEVALPVLALLFAIAPAFLLELSVSGVRQAFFGTTEASSGGVRGFWILRRRLRRQLKHAMKERRRFATEHAEALRQLASERARANEETERLASERFAKLVAEFDGLKTLEEFRDESARVIREHREDIRTLAEKLIELDASAATPRSTPPH